MGRRQLVPAALREELTEYSSLLRALRTADTLDLASRLTESQEPSSSEHDQDSHSSTSPTNTDSTTSRKRTRSRSGSDSDTPLWRKRDQWTRWPIPAKDVPPPDWSLQEELGSIVKQVLMSIEPESDEESILRREKGADTKPDSDSEDEETYIQDLAKLLIPVIEDLHESLFSLICAHTIARSDSMQNRIEPFDWHDLVNILGSPAAAHLVDETILQNVITRMQTLCETTPASSSTSIPHPSPSTALHRHRLAKASRSRLNSLLSKHTASLFEQSLPPPNYKHPNMEQIPKKKPKEKKKRSSAKSDEAVEAEHQDSSTGAGKEARGTKESEGDDESDWIETESDSEG